jgi:hypothetical protein
MKMARTLRLIALVLIAAWFSQAPLLAGGLPLPTAAAPLESAIEAACPDCLDKGVTACGTAEVQYGRRFASKFFAGTPKRGYLPAFQLSGSEFERLARTLPRDAFLTEVEARVDDASLVIVEAGFAAARVIDHPVAIEATFPEPLHQCLQDQSKPWGCCVAADCRGECCEKSLGSPTLTVTWRDDVNNETLTFNFGHSLGSSTLSRKSPTESTLYWCLTDEAGHLRWR